MTSATLGLRQECYALGVEHSQVEHSLRGLRQECYPLGAEHSQVESSQAHYTPLGLEGMS
jgi:hypothetical protein